MRVGDTISYTWETGTLGTATATFVPLPYMSGCDAVQVACEVSGLTATAVVPQEAVGYSDAVVFSSGAGNATLTGEGAVGRPVGQRGAVFVHDGIAFDTAAHGMFCTASEIGSPEVRVNQREARARDGYIDLTEQFGRPIFGNRELSWEFLVTEEDWETRCAEVRDFIASMHGREVTILADDYEGWAFTGRLSVTRPVHKLDGTYIIIIADCGPYRWDGSVFQLASDMPSFSIGPASLYEVSTPVRSYLTNPRSYVLLLNSETATSSTQWRFYVAEVGNLTMSAGSGWPNTVIEWVLGTSDTDTVTGNQFWTPAYEAVDLYIIPVLESGNMSGVSQLKVSVDNATAIRLDTSLGSPVLVKQWTTAAPHKFSVKYTVQTKSTGSGCDIIVNFYPVIVPAGATVPSFQEYNGQGTTWGATLPNPIASGTGIPAGGTVTSKQSPYLYTSGEPMYLFATTLSSTPIEFEMTNGSTTSYDLTQYGYRVMKVNGSIPASESLDPPYIDIDGRRYYAGEGDYEVETNVSGSSAISVYKQGPTASVEGLSI